MSFPNKFGLPLVPGVNVFFDLAAERMWVVYTLRQYVRLDVDHGPFSHPTMHHVSEALGGQTQPMQELTGSVALVMSDICMQVYRETEGNGVGIQRIHHLGSYCIKGPTGPLAGILLGMRENSPWFAIISSLDDLGSLARRFPSKDWMKSELGQYYKGLPQASEDTMFVLTGEAAMAVIIGGMRIGLLR